jgi:hypothetical protein
MGRIPARGYSARPGARKPHTEQCSGVLVGGSVAARWWQGLDGDLEGATGEVSGKVERAGVHRNSVPTVKRRKRRRAVEFNGGRVALVVIFEGGWVL